MRYYRYKTFFHVIFIVCIIFSSSKNIEATLRKRQANIIEACREFGYGDDTELLERARALNHPIINQALFFRDQIARNNYQDILILLQFIKEKPNKSAKNYIDQALISLDSDEKTINTNYESITNNNEISFHLRNGLKVIKERKSYKKAKKLLKIHGEQFSKGVISLLPRHEEVTQLKLALFYLATAGINNQEKAAILAKLNMFFPVKIDKVLKPSINSILLIDKTTNVLWFPHAGYVLGAYNKYGIDCSSFVSKIFGHPTHISTLDYSNIWKYLTNNLKNLNQKVLENTKNYVAIQNIDDLQTGDLVIWRWPLSKSTAGHIVLFVEWTNQASREFIAIEAALLTTKSLEGVGLRKLSIQRENAKTFILRSNQSNNDPDSYEGDERDTLMGKIL